MVLATLMIPDQLRLVPVYLMINAIGLTRGTGPVPRRWSSYGDHRHERLPMRQYFLTIPRDLEEAARIDGAGFFTTFWRVMLPSPPRPSQRSRSSNSRGRGTASSGR